MSAIRRALARVLVLTPVVTALVVGLSGVEATVAAPPAAAAAPSAALVLGTKAVQVAQTKKGTPYGRGGAGPTRFDCSGYTRWVFATLGKKLPHSSQGQRNTTVPVPTSQRQIGDRVFFGSAGRVYHVGIYAGGNRIWHSPKAGDRVRLAKIWTSKVSYGRVR